MAAPKDYMSHGNSLDQPLFGARIKVVGVGGSGSNAVDHMIHSGVKGVDFVVVNCDTQDLHTNLAPTKINIGKNLTRGLGAGMNPDIGQQAAEETKDEIQDILRGADMAFITCGLGGGTGTGAAPVMAKAAKDKEVLTIAVVTKPFSFEGAERARIAEVGLQKLLSESVDAVIVIPNDQLLSIIEKETKLTEAFAMCDEVLRQAVQGIADIITTPGIINLDFADVRTVLADAGTAVMGIGVASGENRATEAVKTAINSPLLEASIEGAKGILFAVAGGDDITMWEINEAAKTIAPLADPNAKIIFGVSRNEELPKGQIKITIIATGFPPDNQMVKKTKEEDGRGIKEGNKSEDEKEKEDKYDAPAFLRRSGGINKTLIHSSPSPRVNMESARREKPIIFETYKTKDVPNPPRKEISAGRDFQKEPSALLAVSEDLPRPEQKRQDQREQFRNSKFVQGATNAAIAVLIIADRIFVGAALVSKKTAEILVIVSQTLVNFIKGAASRIRGKLLSRKGFPRLKRFR